MDGGRGMNGRKTLDIDAVQKAYRRYARGYDFLFGAVFQPGRQEIIDGMALQPGDHVLEVGVGTGISLSLYPSDVQVTGIDISPDMLAVAERRKEEMGLHNVELKVMDAEAMEFEDDRFDKVVAMYVASVVPNPTRLVDEMHRVCRPDGELFIVNHFQSRHPIISRLENLIAPLSKLIGFRPDFSLDDFVKDTGLDIIDSNQVNLLNYWTLLRARNSKPSADDEGLMPVRAAASA